MNTVFGVTLTNVFLNTRIPQPSHGVLSVQQENQDYAQREAWSAQEGNSRYPDCLNMSCSERLIKPKKKKKTIFDQNYVS